MASDQTSGDFLLDGIGRIAPMVAVLVASVAGWWAWRTSLLKALSDRVVHLEKKVDEIAATRDAAATRVAELAAENITLTALLKERDRELLLWQYRYEGKRARQESNPGAAEDSEAEADDDLRAQQRVRGEEPIAVPPGGLV